jgi:hypothetical protein
MPPIRQRRDGSVSLLEAARNAVLFVLFACLLIAGSAAVLFGSLSALRANPTTRDWAGVAALAVFALAVAAVASLLVVLDGRRGTG